MAPERLSPFPEEDQMHRLLREVRGKSSPGRTFAPENYLDLAAIIVDEAARNWISADGHYRDPYEKSDRWQGGCNARFVCPAAILINRAGRTDLLPLTALLMDRLCLLIKSAAGTGRPPFPPGVTDLIAKEILVAYHELDGHASKAARARWAKALAALEPADAFTGPAKMAAGNRLTNYEMYAGVAEWLKVYLGLDDDRSYLEACLRLSMPLFTANGMYRDPGDPALYDLSVRQNLSELLHYGYAGPHRENLDELLRRAGLCTLLMLSPNGFGPFGGRSNWFVHNEAMAAYVSEFEALRYARQGNHGLAMVFRGAAQRAVESIRPFLENYRPPHNLKNAFEPASKHGRDSGYGEYGVYSLLAASLLARTALIADRRIPASARMLGQGGAFLALHPAFHRLFASCGDTLVQVELDAQEHYDATGIGRIHVLGVPAPLGLSAPVAASPAYIVGPHRSDSGLAYCPCWGSSGGKWFSLAGQTGRIADVSWNCLSASPGKVSWETTHVVSCASEVAVRQQCEVSPGVLTVSATVDGPDLNIGFDLPILHSDGRESAKVEIEEKRVKVRFREGGLTVDAPDAESISLDDALHANREAIYRRLRIKSTTAHITVTIRLACDGAGGNGDK